MKPYAVIGAFLVIGLLLPLMTVMAATLLSPRKPNPIKQDIYECGLKTVGETWVQFKVQYYIYALIFVIFDIEVVFLYPWAVAYNQLGLFALVEMLIFAGILLAGLLYAWRKGVLSWV
ncbi:MAG: NADH-quinone oxidoreductase subunit A [Ardenticatenia bacterium]|nr:NADH-quinone oxidoreductase subunit A [Ardenticatenia bacterium]